MTFTYKSNIQTKTKTQVNSIKLSKNTLNSNLIRSFQNIEEPKLLSSFGKSSTILFPTLDEDDSGKVQVHALMNRAVKFLNKTVAT